MLSAVRGFIVPVVIVVATAHTALSVAQYHRIQRLNDEVASLQREVDLITNSHDLCVTQSEAKDNEINALKGMVGMLIEKEGAIREDFNSLSDRWEQLKGSRNECVSEGEERTESGGEPSNTPFLISEYGLLEQAYCHATSGGCITP